MTSVEVISQLYFPLILQTDILYCQSMCPVYHIICIGLYCVKMYFVYLLCLCWINIVWILRYILCFAKINSTYKGLKQLTHYSLGDGNNFKSLIFQPHFTDGYPEYFPWNCWMLQDSSNNRSTLVQVMARVPSGSKPLPDPMLSQILLPYSVTILSCLSYLITRPQWVEIFLAGLTQFESIAMTSRCKYLH